ncbi:MAG: tetratricopeptide repeat protein [Candidatus Lokiarchaeota archaeon]|nr:tetratricopeptide repeat protein [Candidatus Harpocratesius repetitus]
MENSEQSLPYQQSKMNLQNAPIQLDPHYSLTTAVSDLKRGIAYYKSKKWKLALNPIQHALSKFQSENQAKLVLECEYLLGNIYMQMNRYSEAFLHFQTVEFMASKLNSPQYWQQAIFNMGFLQYKLEHYSDAVEFFKKLTPENSQYINSIHLIIFTGRSLIHLKNYEDGIILLIQATKAILHSNQSMGQNNVNSQKKRSDFAQLAQIYAEIGNGFFSFNLQEIKQQGFEIFHRDQFNHRINQSIEYYLKSIEIWERLEEKANQVEIFRIIANIYGFLRDSTLQIHYLQKAIEITEELHDFPKMISLIRNLVHYYESLNRYQEIISLLFHTLELFSQYVYIDQDVIAEFQYSLGNALFHLEEYDSALKQLFTALNTYQKKEITIQEELNTLSLIVQIYAQIQDKDNQEYYQKKFEEAKINIQSPNLISTKSTGPLKDLWIFTQTGIELFSFHPDMDINPSLFGGFVSALQSISQEIAEDSLNSFVIGNNRYTIYVEPRENLYILGRSLYSTPEKQIQQILKIINQKFYETYEVYIENFSGNVSIFSNFSQILANLDFSSVDVNLQ